MVRYVNGLWINDRGFEQTKDEKVCSNCNSKGTKGHQPVIVLCSQCKGNGVVKKDKDDN